ncbi:DUF5677 domain-containing protein [Vibrio sp. A1-b2]|uniref:DUF5677 domain-containing protein n=1 Tax=Vibrio sp. A1-b2 TaxID=2912248 RepID=UPI001F1EDADF|nr:DUF5677 domain-containing protein [Vibrio sp. A1-b2]MCF7360870.1 DUF5677 domain-containing protein [Vibrio sp. A1-b2]
MEQNEYLNDFLKARNDLVKVFDCSYSLFIEKDTEDKDQIFYILSKKFINHINSFYYILSGTDFNDVIPDSHQIDHSSAKVVLRSAFETYVTMAHIFWNYPERAQLRFLIYKHSGYRERQKFARTNATVNNEKISKKILEESLRIKELESEISLLAGQHGIPENYISYNLEKGWKSGKSWAEIAKETNLSNTYIDLSYPYFCGYSHSGYEACMQLITDELEGYETRLQRHNFTYFYATYLVAIFYESFCSFLLSNKNFLYQEEHSMGDIILKYDKAIQSMW